MTQTSNSHSVKKKVWSWIKGFFKFFWIFAGWARSLLVITLLALSLLFNGLLIFNDVVLTAVDAVASAVNLTTANSRKNAKLTELQNKSNANKKLVEDKTKRVNQRMKKAVLREIAVKPAEVLPLIGTAVIVGATAWELRDLCETMKDMEELKKMFNTESTPENDVVTVCGKEVLGK